MAVADREQAATARPRGLAEARDAMLDGGAGARRLRILGAGTKQDWGGPVEAPLVVETGGMDRLIAHNAGDMTAEVEAGMPLHTLNELLGEAGQWLALDPPAARHARPATVGGIVATGDVGPRRLRYGTPRDLVIGMTYVLPDGTIGRSGGNVIKNVAGYDLAKLLAGSMGTLGLIASVVVRLHPRPAASRTVRVAASARQAAAATRALIASPLEPVAVEWDGGAGTLLVRLEGGADGVKDRAGRVLGLAAEQGLDAAAAKVLAGAAERAAWTAYAGAVTGAEGDTVARAAAVPDRLEAVADALDQASQAAGVQASLASSSALGLHTCRVRGGDPAGHAELVRAWRDAVEALGGTVRLRRRAPGVDGLVAAWGSPPSAATLMRRVKRELDPEDRCGPGRFSPWW
jgi:glycolate oxidase FAD binding subunit